MGALCTHTYLAFVLAKTRSIWITALAHITFNNASTALGFFVSIQNQTLANAGLVLTMVITVFVGFWKFRFKETLLSIKVSENKIPIAYSVNISQEQTHPEK